MNDKIVEQSQTKVESGSKYRVRLSGLVLLNTAVTRGSVDNLDIPQIAVPPEAPGVAGSFSGSLRQSQIGIETFGPDIAGARTSANVKFDFAGGFPNAPNGAAFGVVRLRTGTVRLDWTNTSDRCGPGCYFLRAAYSHNSLFSRNSRAVLYRQSVELDPSGTNRASLRALRKLGTSDSGGHSGFADRRCSPTELSLPECWRSIRPAGLRDARRLQPAHFWTGI